MSDQTAQPPEPPVQTQQLASPAPAVPLAPGVEQIDPAVKEALMNAIRLCAASAAAADAPADKREAGNAALSFAQALVIIDPQLVAPQGVPPNALHPPLPHIQTQVTPPAAPAAAAPVEK